ncbi:MICOS complex subunit 26/27 isoform X5 [Rhodnius prolixus]|uniref:MICOS complex subunit 26/27 isoform X5 n=1 Tax=Rhodnius prolixus TaxID=13249 RepID=UPI003D18E427
MYSSVILRRIFLPASGCGFAVVHAKEKNEKEDKCDPERKLVRACDLPVYAEEKKCLDCTPPKKNEPDTLFTETVKCARKEMWYVMDQARIVKQQIEDGLEDLKSSSEEYLKYLREESNVAPRIGAIAVGGLSGYILALRRGIFRKLIYTSIGAGGMAALCYPREAKEYSHEALQLLKRYIIIGYHFINGVTRDLTGYQLPPLPNGHLVISDSAHPGSEAVPSSAHILPPTATPTHIPLPHEDPHEITRNHHHHQSSEHE